VLTRNVRLEGFTTDDWTRLAEVLRAPRRPRERDDPSRHGEAPPAVAEQPSGRRKGGVIAVTTGARLRKLLSTESGRLDLAAQAWPEPLEDLAERHGARWAAEIHTGALEELMERFAERLRREHDALEQILLLIAVLRELEQEGAIEVWPWRLSAWPVPHQRVLMRALDALCPDGKALLFGAFRRGELFTSLTLRRRGDGFDLILGPEHLRGDMGLISGDWRRDYRHLARAASAASAPLALGVYGEVETLRDLIAHPTPGAWAAAVAARDVIVSPVTPAVAIPLGVDVGRAAVVAVRDLAERLGAGGWLGADSPLMPALTRMRELSGLDQDIVDLLGFNPLQLLKKLISRDHATPQDEAGEES
jgi:hypothetical protein